MITSLHDTADFVPKTQIKGIFKLWAKFRNQNSANGIRKGWVTKSINEVCPFEFGNRKEAREFSVQEVADFLLGSNAENIVEFHIYNIK